MGKVSRKPKSVTKSKIRSDLRLWQEEFGQEEPEQEVDLNGDLDEAEAVNSFSRLSDATDLRSKDEMAENEKDELANFTQSRPEDLEDLDPYHRFLRKGDLVELEFPKSEQDSDLAVFVRRVGTNDQQCQFLTVRGKWVHLPERQVQYAIPEYMDPELIDRILPYLPDQEMTEELMDKAAFFDLSVPRTISAPIVSRLLQFQRESEELYRQHASRLDNAHALLAHPTDLKFGNLEQIATKLLGTHDRKGPLPLTALFTVRKALSHAGFAFGADRRSHRLTGFLQIRSMDQVKMVDRVRQWFRDWQDALAVGCVKREDFVRRSNGAIFLFDYIEKARRLIDESRTMRDATALGTVGPTKTRNPTLPGQDTIQYGESFSNQDRDITRFMEGWACSNIFLGLPRFESLPPLIMQATGRYDEVPLTQGVGFMFLQEIGLLLPYENRVRFDQHLLLPSSQHSKPLEKLMTHVLGLKDKHGFEDSMKELRHDFGDLPVFCIDGEGAHEIDDGLSIEPAEDGRYWMHIHIANPTAFFDREAPLAKMARHMTETIYMPERAYLMLPRWATQAHFSLEANRPCLTFSAKLDMSGEYLEHKIRPGIIRNVHLISPDEVAKALGSKREVSPEKILSVGARVPHARRSKKRATAEDVTEEQVEMLRKMLRLAEKRQGKRRGGGGIFLDSHQPDIQVWNSNGAGLGWEHPSRLRARRVLDDPSIQYKSKEMTSWFAMDEAGTDVLVREMMLLACEIGARWCSERQVPIIYRGSMARPDAGSAEDFHREVLVPAMEKNGGVAPMHLGFKFLRQMGATTLTTEPLTHQVLGLSHYTKATSPLRRYGDMLLHWQIEAALREEAKGRNLIGRDNGDIVPFSVGNLKQIMVGLQPREGMIRRAMRYAEDTWTAQLMFRAFHYDECELPKTFHAFLFFDPQARGRDIQVMIKEYSFGGAMMKPDDLGLGEAKAGDWWEVELLRVEVFYRKMLFKPIRLLSRWEF